MGPIAHCRFNGGGKHRKLDAPYCHQREMVAPPSLLVSWDGGRLGGKGDDGSLLAINNAMILCKKKVTMAGEDK